MNKSPKDKFSHDDEIYRQTAEYVMELFTKHMVNCIKDGKIKGTNTDQFKALSQQFMTEHENHMIGHIRDHFEAYAEWKERELWSRSRQRPFDRILVKRFSKWLPKHGELTTPTSGMFSRRMLPGFLKAMEMMAGAHEQKKVEAFMEHRWHLISDAKGKEVDWEDLYDDDEANSAVDIYLAAVAKSFEEFEDRVQWFMRAINNSLGDPEKYAFEGEGIWGWSITEQSTLHLLAALYAPLKHYLLSKEKIKSAQESFGKEKLISIQKIIMALKKEFKET